MSMRCIAVYFLMANPHWNQKKCYAMKFLDVKFLIFFRTACTLAIGMLVRLVLRHVTVVFAADLEFA